MLLIISTILTVLFLIAGYLSFKITKDKLSYEYKNLLEKKEAVLSTDNAVTERFKELEGKIDEAFMAYELARDISPIVDKDKLLSLFVEKLKGFDDIDDIGFSSHYKQGYENYALSSDSPRYLAVLSPPRRIKEYIPLFLYQLNLCLERISLYKELQKLSIHDSLTQVYNRRYLTERIDREFERAKQLALKLAFLMIDIDFFKKINDTYGHIVGDVVLRNVAFIIKDTVREIDTVGRFGGEEFFVILPETSKEEAIAVARRIVDRVASAKIRAFDENVKTTVSIGVASYPENSMKLDMLIEITDKALYESKGSGRNRVSWF